MYVCSPVGWPISKCLDIFLGTHDHNKRFGKTDLKALIGLHALSDHSHEGLTADEIKVKNQNLPQINTIKQTNSKKATKLQKNKKIEKIYFEHF